MTESQRKAALEALDILYDYAHAYADVSHQHQALGSLIEKRETIRAALQAPQPEEVTVEELWDLFLNDAYENHPEDGSCMEEWYAEYLRIKYPQGIRIIREKSDD